MKELVEGIDYNLNENGLMVFTAIYLSSRGFCCENGCLNCPYVTGSRQGAHESPLEMKKNDE
jgi:hypothetical protein